MKRKNETPRRSQRTKDRLKRKENEYQLDLKRYNELLNKGMEYDIPPKRAKCKRRSKRVLKKIEPPQNYPKRPQFSYSGKSDNVISKPQSQSKDLPPELKESTAKSFENKIQLKHTYPELLKIINQNLSLNTIDISLIHNLVPKNLEYELERFSIPTDFYNNNIEQPNYSEINEIDFFFAETLKSELSLV